MSHEDTKPIGKFQCRACRQIWDGSEVRHSARLIGLCECADITCGAVADKLPDEPHNNEGTKRRIDQAEKEIVTFANTEIVNWREVNFWRSVLSEAKTVIESQERELAEPTPFDVIEQIKADGYVMNIELRVTGWFVRIWKPQDVMPDAGACHSDLGKALQYEMEKRIFGGME